MENNLKTASGNLAEQTKKWDIAIHYTYGDAELAKKMLSGEYKDIYLIKIAFSSSTLNGLVLIFYNYTSRKIIFIHGLVSNSFIIQEIKTTMSWKSFESEIDKFIQLKEHDDVLVGNMKEEMEKAFSADFTNNLIKLIEMDDEISINHSFKKIVQDKLGYMNVKLSADFEIISSLDLELNSKNSSKINIAAIKNDAEKKKQEKEKKIELENKNNPLAGREVKLLIQGSFILSPIKGVALAKVKNGDRVMVKIVDSNPKAISVAKAFGAYTEEGEFKPIKGRVISIEHSAANGYVVFLIVAKGIFARIDEDEDNIKVLMDPLTANKQNSKKAKAKISPKIIIFFSILLALILGAGIFLMIK